MQIKRKMVLGIYLFLPLSGNLLLGAFASPTSQPPTELSITQPANLTSISNDHLNCIDLLNPFSHRPKYSDCTLAIRQLPNNPAQGSFHNRGGDDFFKLPVQKTVSSCTVRVDLLAASSTVGASWEGIGARALILNRLCLRTTFPIYKGGWATFARDQRIVISLGYPSQPSR